MTFTDLHDLPLSAYRSRIFSCCSSYYCSPSSKAEEHTASIYIFYIHYYILTDWINVRGMIFYVWLALCPFRSLYLAGPPFIYLSILSWGIPSSRKPSRCSSPLLYLLIIIPATLDDDCSLVSPCLDCELWGRAWGPLGLTEDMMENGAQIFV